MMDGLQQLGVWHWSALVVIFAIGEVFVGTGILLGVAGAALGVVLLLLLWPEMGWAGQFVSFAATACVLWLLRRNLHTRWKTAATDHPTLNKRMSQYIGRVVVIVEPVVAGQGRAQVDDSIWHVRSQHEIAVGTQVKIIATDDNTLIVEPVTSN